MISVERLIDLSVKSNIVPDKEFHYLWDLYAKWQLDSLRQIGLKPEHRLLDIGCGPMRLGHLAIPYLEDGHYYGIEAFLPYIAFGKEVLSEIGIQKSYKIVHSATFEFQVVGVKFDYAIAQSVFTHLSQAQIESCVAALKNVMKPASRLLFTYIFDRTQKGLLYFGIHPMMYPGIRSEDFFREIAIKHRITFLNSDLKHPTQRVAMFVF